MGWKDPLEKEIATHSSTLAWKIPWMEEPRRLQSMGLQRVGHDRETSLSLSQWCGAPFNMLAILINLLWRNVYSIVFYILKIRWLCCCWSVTSLYILDINPLSGTWLADIFPHFLGLLFTLLIWYPLIHKLKRSSSSLSRSLSTLKDYSGEGFPLVVQWLRTHCNAEDADLIPGWGSKIPHAAHQLSPRGTTRESVCCNKRSHMTPLRPNTAK